MTGEGREFRDRCDCCGEFLGPEHVPLKGDPILEEMRHQIETLTYDLGKARELSTEIRSALDELKRARKAGNGYLGAQAVERLEKLHE